MVNYDVSGLHGMIFLKVIYVVQLKATNISQDSNKLTNHMQQSLQFITRRLFTSQHVSGVLTPIIRSSTTVVAASGFSFRAW